MNLSETDGALHCGAHPGTVTYLRCAQCNVPICPRCLVMTPVGAKCRQCARGRLQAAFVLTQLDLAIAFFTAVIGAVVLGIAGSVLTRLIPFLGILTILFPIAAGLAISRLIRRFLPRKHGTALKVSVGVGVVVAVLVLGIGDFFLFDPASLFVPAVAGTLIRNWLLHFLLSPFELIFLGLGVYIGVKQVE